MKCILRFIPGSALGLVVAAGLVISAFTSVAVAALSQEEQVAAARRDWLIGVATEKRIAAELARYQASDQTSPEVITLYETYLDRVHRLTEEKRRVLEQLDAERGRRAKAPPSTQGTPGRSTAEVYDPQIPEDQTLDQVPRRQLGPHGLHRPSERPFPNQPGPGAEPEEVRDDQDGNDPDSHHCAQSPPEFRAKS